MGELVGQAAEFFTTSSGKDEQGRAWVRLTIREDTIWGRAMKKLGQEDRAFVDRTTASFAAMVNNPQGSDEYMAGLVGGWSDNGRLREIAQGLCDHPSLGVLPDEGVAICEDCGREFEMFLARRAS